MKLIKCKKPVQEVAKVGEPLVVKGRKVQQYQSLDAIPETYEHDETTGQWYLLTD